MFIDDICDDFPVFYGNKLSETTIFKINEKTVLWSLAAKEMLSANDKKKQGIENFPQLLPYSNICILFNDEIIWCVKKNKDEQGIAETIYCRPINKNMFSAYRTELNNAKTEEDIARLNNLILDPTYYITISTDKLQMMGCGIKQNFKHLGGIKEHDVEIEKQLCLLALYRFLSILSCKNIRKKKIQADKKIQKKRIKNKKPLLLEYYVLELKNISFGSQKSQAKDLWSNRIHFCRGHMKAYTKEHPLFGKLVGRYWWAPHARGNKKRGVIIKDYQMPEEIIKSA